MVIIYLFPFVIQEVIFHQEEGRNKRFETLCRSYKNTNIISFGIIHYMFSPYNNERSWASENIFSAMSWRVIFYRRVDDICFRLDFYIAMSLKQQSTTIYTSRHSEPANIYPS